MAKIDVSKRILSANEQQAIKNHDLLHQHSVACYNLISSPGSGKTTILARTISDLRDEIRIGVIEGDIETDIDAQRIRATNAPVIQINTAGACHLSASQVATGLSALSLSDLDLVLIENVGNLVCPAAFGLGEDGKVVVLSVPEGDDKPAKYPAIFAKSRALLLNKIDLLDSPGLTFDMDRVKTDARRMNKDLRIFPISATTGAGMGDWYAWLEDQLARYPRA